MRTLAKLTILSAMTLLFASSFIKCDKSNSLFLKKNEVLEEKNYQEVDGRIDTEFKIHGTHNNGNQHLLEQTANNSSKNATTANTTNSSSNSNATKTNTTTNTTTTNTTKTNTTTNSTGNSTKSNTTTNTTGNSTKTNTTTNSTGNSTKSNSTNSTANNTKPVKIDPLLKGPKYEELRLISWMIRAFQTGFKRGLYKVTNYNSNQQCFGNSTLSGLIRLQIAQDNGTFFATSSMFIMQEILYLTISNCDFDEMGYDLIRFFSTQELSFEIIINNLLSRVMQLTNLFGEFSSLTEDGYQPDPKVQTQVIAYYQSIGSIVGKLLRYLSGFDAALLK